MGKKKAADCALLPGWLVTYGDLMSLLLTFFILLQSFSSIQESEFKKAIGSIMIALGVHTIADTMIITPMLGKNGIGKSGAQGEAEIEAEEMMDRLNNEFKSIMESQEDSTLAETIQMEITDQGLQITIKDSILFPSGEATIKDDFKVVLNAVGKVVAPKMNHFDMVIEGHTDNIPINTAKFPSNWELSSGRALSVLRYMVEDRNLPAKQLTAVGFGEYHPIADNQTVDGRSKNRRVEILLNKRAPTVNEFKGEKVSTPN